VAGTSVDPDEVERDIRDHVDSALRTAEDPVSRASLDDVLARLGDPSQWVPDDELPAWRRVWRRVAYGPEEWRLPYLSFGLVVAALVTLPIGGALLLIPAWLVSRAALDLPAMRPETLGARKWLIYPPLVAAALIVAAFLIAGGAAPLLVWGIAEHGLVKELGFEARSGAELARLYAGFVLATLGAWWLIAAGLVAIFLRQVRWLCRPFGERLRRVPALMFAAIAAAMGIAGAVVMRAAILQ
ncbi:MAG TPA: hypothetical protein VGF40_16030, partial [Thermoanaerobaculia bacterium]